MDTPGSGLRFGPGIEVRRRRASRQPALAQLAVGRISGEVHELTSNAASTHYRQLAIKTSAARIGAAFLSLGEL
jgi:hypothetical protein